MFIEDGSHCADMVSSDPANDTPSMVAARREEEATVASWLDEVRWERAAAGF